MSKYLLVAEDHGDNRQILRDLLGSAGHKLTEAENGEEAIRCRLPAAPRPQCQL
jgi:two-component system, cell cycle response regulator DivK